MRSAHTLSILAVTSLVVSVAPPTAHAAKDELEAKTKLMRPAGAPDDDAKGEIEIESEDGEQVIDVEAEDLDTSLTYEIFLEHPAGSGTMNSIGFLEEDDGDFIFEEDTDEGGTLPFGASEVSELSGRTLEVRSGGAVYLTGQVPFFDGASFKEKSKLKGSGKGQVRVEMKAKKGTQEFRLDVKKQGKKTLLEIWIENPDTDTLELVATVPAKKSGKASWKVRSKDGDALPHGVLNLQDLGGRDVEVRRVSDGAVRLSGVVPIGS